MLAALRKQPQGPRTLYALPMSLTSCSAKTDVVVVIALEVDEKRRLSTVEDRCLPYLLKRSFVDLLVRKFPICTTASGKRKMMKTPVHRSTMTPAA